MRLALRVRHHTALAWLESAVVGLAEVRGADQRRCHLVLVLTASHRLHDEVRRLEVNVADVTVAIELSDLELGSVLLHAHAYSRLFMYLGLVTELPLLDRVNLRGDQTLIIAPLIVETVIVAGEVWQYLLRIALIAELAIALKDTRAVRWTQHVTGTVSHHDRGPTPAHHVAR